MKGREHVMLDIAELNRLLRRKEDGGLNPPDDARLLALVKTLFPASVRASWQPSLDPALDAAIKDAGGEEAPMDTRRTREWMESQKVLRDDWEARHGLDGQKRKRASTEPPSAAVRRRETMVNAMLDAGQPLKITTRKQAAGGRR